MSEEYRLNPYLTVRDAVVELAATADAVAAIACAETTTTAGVTRMMGRAHPPPARSTTELDSATRARYHRDHALFPTSGWPIIMTIPRSGTKLSGSTNVTDGLFIYSLPE